MRKEAKSVLRLCAGVALLWFGCLGSANALVRGSIEPAFTDGSSTNFGFGWTADILVDTSTGSCAASGLYVGIDTICTGATLLSATGTLTVPYQGTAITNPSPFDFTQSTTASAFNDISVYFDGSAVVGLATGLNDPIGFYTLDAGLTSNSYLSGGDYIWLAFNFAPTPIPITPLVSPTTDAGQSADLILQSLCPTFDDDNGSSADHVCTPDPNGTVLTGLAGPNDITLSVVPEPGSIALISGALLAIGFIRRRKQLH